MVRKYWDRFYNWGIRETSFTNFDDVFIWVTLIAIMVFK